MDSMSEASSVYQIFIGVYPFKEILVRRSLVGPFGYLKKKKKTMLSMW